MEISTLELRGREILHTKHQKWYWEMNEENKHLSYSCGKGKRVFVAVLG